MSEVELTPEEVRAFSELQREGDPSPLVEERVVRALRSEGVLGRRPRSWARGPWMGLAAAAAAVILFASGAGFGHWMGARTTAQTLLAVREQDAAQLAQSIQEAGSAYVTALSALSELRGAADGEDDPAQQASSAALDQGREVALGSLYAAAFELARLSPGDSDVLRILEILAQRRRQGQDQDQTVRNVVYF